MAHEVHVMMEIRAGLLQPGMMLRVPGPSYAGGKRRKIVV
jgi:hypothetical protein